MIKYYSVYVLKPLTDAAQSWIDEHISPDATHWGGGVAIEARYMQDILIAISTKNLRKEFEVIS